MTDKSAPRIPEDAYHSRDSGHRLIPDSDEPFALLEDWLKAAQNAEPNDSTAMSLATVDKTGMPDVRIVLLRGLSPAGGFEFYTNYESAKGIQIAACPKAALCFHWKSLRRQVRVRGTVEKLPDARSDTYFNQRVLQSRIAAIASKQSQQLESRSLFTGKVADLTRAHAQGKPISRPAFWGGYRLVPASIEFWQDQAFRMHDRVHWVRSGNSWTKSRLYP